MNTIKEFLGARISEDEDVAQRSIDGHVPGFRWMGGDTADTQQEARWNPWRVLTSCLVKRLILAAHRDIGHGVEHRPSETDLLVGHTCSTCGRSDHHAVAWPCYTLRVMALDWEDHPDYRRQWRPAGLPSGGRCA